MHKRMIAVAGAVVALTAACGDKATEPSNDAPRAGTVNNLPAQVIAMPDGFNNVASKCDGPNRVYTLFHDGNYGSVAVVANDPRCR